MKRSNRSGFTIIELMVVIAIMAIIAGILFGGITRAIRAARNNTATTEAKATSLAIAMFFRDYGWLPVPASDQGGSTDGEVNSQNVIKVLLGTTDTRTVNPKGKTYLDLNVAAEDGTFLDPWGNQYRILLDLNYDGKIDYKTGTFTSKSIVISDGRETSDPEDDLASVVNPD